MPPTNRGQPPLVLVDGLERFDLGGRREHVVAAVLAALAAQDRVATDAAEVSVTFTGDGEITALNEEWLDRPGPTDVIAFCLGDDPLVADVYASVETARRNAADLGVPLGEELLRLVVHGVLHAAGFDHPEGGDRAAAPMYALQERVLRRLLEGRTQT